MIAVTFSQGYNLAFRQQTFMVQRIRENPCRNITFKMRRCICKRKRNSGLAVHENKPFCRKIERKSKGCVNFGRWRVKKQTLLIFASSVKDFTSFTLFCVFKRFRNFFSEYISHTLF